MTRSHRDIKITLAILPVMVLRRGGKTSSHVASAVSLPVSQGVRVSEVCLCEALLQSKYQDSNFPFLVLRYFWDSNHRERQGGDTLARLIPSSHIWSLNSSFAIRLEPMTVTDDLTSRLLPLCTSLAVHPSSTVVHHSQNQDSSTLNAFGLALNSVIIPKRTKHRPTSSLASLDFRRVTCITYGCTHCHCSGYPHISVIPDRPATRTTSQTSALANCAGNNSRLPIIPAPNLSPNLPEVPSHAVRLSGLPCCPHFAVVWLYSADHVQHP